MAKLYNLARMTTTTTGSDVITLGTAVAGRLDFETAGVSDGETISYGITEGNSSEVGRGVYGGSGSTLTRSVLSSTNGGNPIVLVGSGHVFITALAEDVKPDIGARVYNNANISIPNGSFTSLTFNTEVYDTDTIHDTGTNPSFLTCKTAGKYIVWGHITFASHATGRRLVQVRKDGTTDQQNIMTNPDTGGNSIGMGYMTIMNLAVNAYVELQVYQTSGGALNILTLDTISPTFGMQMIAEVV